MLHEVWPQLESLNLGQLIWSFFTHMSWWGTLVDQGCLWGCFVGPGVPHRVVASGTQTLNAEPRGSESQRSEPLLTRTLLVEPVPSPTRVGTQGPPLTGSNAKESADMTEGHFV